MLWIAFIFQYLWDTKQQQFGKLKVMTVVNCFHFSVSLGYKTTKSSFITRWYWLWIAFIFQYLWDTKQRQIGNRTYWESCELLSFFSIFGIQNNFFSCFYIYPSVVNCFHFSVSLGYKTTPSQITNLKY